MDPAQFRVYPDSSDEDTRSSHRPDLDDGGGGKETRRSRASEDINEATGFTPGDKGRLHSLCINEEVFDRWCRVGNAEGLKTDTEIASFFINQYESTYGKESPAAYCSHCHAPLVVVCSRCRVLSQQNKSDESETAATALPVTDSSNSRVKTEPDVELEGEMKGESSFVLETFDKLLEVESVGDSGNTNRRLSLPQEKNAILRTDFVASASMGCHSIRDESLDSEHHHNDFSTGDTDCTVDRQGRTCTEPKGILLQDDASASECSQDLQSPAESVTSKVRGEKRKSRKEGVCPQCGKFYKKLKVHLTLHSADRPYKCNFCAATFKTKQYLNKHTELHTEEKNHQCQTCGKSFTTLNYLKMHASVHQGKILWKCSVCNLTLSCKKNLKIHMRRHTGDRQYVCDACGKRFCSSNALTTHRKYKHSEEKTFYKCQQCDKVYTTKSSLRTHQTVHSNSSPFLCQLCGASFKRRDILADHIKYHANTREYKCELCGKGFNTKSRLYQHSLLHTEKRLKCPNLDCTYACHSAAELQIHIRQHTGERPFKCKYCPKAFAANGRLLKHQRMHEEKKMYVCEVCGASFPIKGNLTKHMRKHTGEKPYQCSECGAAFAWKSGLACHLRKHVQSMSHV